MAVTTGKGGNVSFCKVDVGFEHVDVLCETPYEISLYGLYFFGVKTGDAVSYFFLRCIDIGSRAFTDIFFLFGRG